MKTPPKVPASKMTPVSASRMAPSLTPAMAAKIRSKVLGK